MKPTKKGTPKTGVPFFVIYRKSQRFTYRHELFLLVLGVGFLFQVFDVATW